MWEQVGVLERLGHLRALDSHGRDYRAPAWDGPITALTLNELHERVESLGQHIGGLFTVYETGGTWREATRGDLDQRQLSRWVRLRLEALRLIDDRENTDNTGTVDDIGGAR